MKQITLLTLLLVACGDDDLIAHDAAIDTSMSDAAIDASEMDAGSDSGAADGGPAGADASVADSGAADSGEMDAATPRIENIDVLLMIDNSGSMEEEQAILSENLGLLLGRLDADVHLGVISSDMGIGGHDIPTCNEFPVFGDDALLQRGERCEMPISLLAPPYMNFGAGSDFDQASCMSTLGAEGCGFEQQLEAVLKSVTPASSSTTFHRSTRGHAGAANEDFLRDDSLLVVIMLTDEDDCSAATPDLFDLNNPVLTPNANLRCHEHEELLHPVGRFVDGLLAVHPPERLVFATIAGIPEDLENERGVAPDFESLVGEEGLRDERMIPRPAPEENGIVPVCQISETRSAAPAVRIVQVAEGLHEAGAETVLGSICRDSYAGFMENLAMMVESRR